MAAFTGGPWQVQDNTDQPYGQLRVESAAWGCVADCGQNDESRKFRVSDEARANARLIAGSPNMLGALECSTATLEACFPHVSGERKRMVEMQIAANREIVASILGD